MLIAARNAMMAGGKRLPYDAEVEFLESTGTQWIDTGYKPNSITEFSIVYKPAYYGTTFRCVYGVQGGNDRQRFYLVLSGSSAYKIQINSIANGSEYCGVNSNGTITDTINGNFAPDNRRVSVVVNNPQKRVVLNGVEYAMPNWWGVDLSCPHPLALFGRKSGEAIQTENLFIGKIERCHISENGVLVRDYIPVRKGTVGYLYDRVSGKLFGNAGTGDFVLGPDVVPVEYIENVASSYINTEFKADNACKFEIDFENKRTGGGYGPWLFGSRNGSVSAVDKSCVFLGYTGGTSYAMMGSAMPVFNQGLVVSGRHTFTMSLSEGVGIDGVAVATYTPSEQAQTYTNTHPNALFNMWNGSSVNNYFIGRVYSFKVLKSGVPQIDFRPVRVGTDATSWEGAMMDVLTRRVYRNAGTGAFGYGNDLKYPIPSE